jgi:hypothetical protein
VEGEEGWQTQVSSCVWVPLAKGIDCFIEYDVTKDIDPATGDIKTLEPLMKIVIPKEHTLLGAKLELVITERAKVWPTCTPKSVHAYVIWFFLKKFLKRGGEACDLGWKPIYDICGGQEGLIPILERHVCMGKE